MIDLNSINKIWYRYYNGAGVYFFKDDLLKPTYYIHDSRRRIDIRKYNIDRKEKRCRKNT